MYDFTLSLKTFHSHFTMRFLNWGRVTSNLWVSFSTIEGKIIFKIHLRVTIPLPTISLFGPMSTAFQFHEVRLGHIVNLENSILFTNLHLHIGNFASLWCHYVRMSSSIWILSCNYLHHFLHYLIWSSSIFISLHFEGLKFWVEHSLFNLDGMKLTGFRFRYFDLFKK